jgi:hypothetical protein
MKYLIALGMIAIFIMAAIGAGAIIFFTIKDLISDCGIKVKKIKLKGWY